MAVKMYLTTSHLKHVGVSFLLLKFFPKHKQILGRLDTNQVIGPVSGPLGKPFLLRRDSEVPQMTSRTPSDRLQSLGFLIRPRFLLAVTSGEIFPSDGLLVLSE